MPLIHTLRGIAWTAPWVLHLLLVDLLLSLLLPISLFAPKFAYDASSHLAYTVWNSVQAIFTSFNGAKITTSGANLPPNESAIVVSNHISWTDFYMIQALALRSRMLGRCRWFAKKQLKWVPFLGWGLWAMGMPLVSRNWVKDSQELDHIFGKIRRNKTPIWLISYSEATRFTSKKHKEAVEWCKANDKPLPRNTLYPRTRGFIAQVSELRRSEHVTSVYDCTIAYARGTEFLQAPTFWETLSTPNLSQKYQFHIDVQRFPLDELPTEEADLAKWLEGRWVVKGEMLEGWKRKFAQTGVLGPASDKSC